jgi:hypothetical protein
VPVHRRRHRHHPVAVPVHRRRHVLRRHCRLYSLLLLRPSAGWCCIEAWSLRPFYTGVHPDFFSTCMQRQAMLECMLP